MRREKKKAAKRARIEATARDLFHAHGYDGTTIRAIAEAADVGVGTVLVYGESKLGLLVSVFFRRIEAIVAAQVQTFPHDAPLVTQLAHLFRGFYEYYAAYPELSRVFVKESLFLSPPFAAQYDALTDQFLTALVGVIASHRARLHPDVNAPMLARGVFSIYLTSVVVFLRAEAPDPDAAIADLEDALTLTLAPLWRGASAQ